MVHTDAAKFDGRAFDAEMRRFKRGDRCLCVFFHSHQALAGESYLNGQC
jgi:hypothetical protein